MPANDVYEMAIDHTLAGQNLTSVYHAKQIGVDGTGDGRAAMHLWWEEHFEALFLACVSINLVLVQSRIRQLQAVETQSLITALAGAGGIAIDQLPPQSCAILRTHATPLLRRGTGHVKMSGITVDHTDAGRIDAALFALIAAFGVPMETDKTEATTGYVFHMSVLSQVDDIARPILKTESLTRIKTVHSRSVGVGS